MDSTDAPTQEGLYTNLWSELLSQWSWLLQGDCQLVCPLGVQRENTQAHEGHQELSVLWECTTRIHKLSEDHQGQLLLCN